jgi:hypothetical protein
MTAREFISELFARPGYGCASNMRRLTAPQFELLIKLIGEDANAGAVQRGLGRSLVWKPPGAEKYVITEDPRGQKHTVTIMPGAAASGSGLLF